jgi:Flp pilus assembly secretin CpaC
MAALCVGDRMRPAPLSAGRFVRLGAVCGLLVALAAPAAAAQPIVVFVDRATIMRLPDRAATVVVGNPLIADLSVQRSGIAVVTGKGYGATNFIVLDKSGAVLMEKTVEVKGPREETVVVYRGVTRQTYSCTPDCDPRITLGDTSKDNFDAATGEPTDYFGKTLGQTVTRDAQATAAAAKH